MMENEAELVARGKMAVVEMGQSLKAIRDKRLYRNDAAPFESYCKTKFGFDPETVELLIKAAEAAEGGVS